MKLNDFVTQFNKITESREYDFNDILRVFLPIAKKITKLDKLPTIILKKKIQDSQQPTMGQFNPDNYTIQLAIGNRQPVDSLRTLAHELHHAKQFVDGDKMDPSTGSQTENDAHIAAGIIMREFNKLHPEFLSAKAISEGGNLSNTSPGWQGMPGEHEAEEIDLKLHNRDFMVGKIRELLSAQNDSFAATYGRPIWDPKLIASGKMFSGSSLQFFDVKSVSTQDFMNKLKKVKVGDIDTQVDQEIGDDVAAWLKSIVGQKIGNGTFVGFNSSLSALWMLDEPPVKIQIDYELGPYNKEKNEPSDWFAYSHSSHYDDMASGIKGVFHKWINRALPTSQASTKYVARVLKKSTKISPEPVTDADYSFAVTSAQGGGLSSKYQPYIDPETNQPMEKDGIPVMQLLEPSQRSYDQNLSSQFQKVYGVKPKAQDLKLQQSFVGTIDLMNRYLDDTQREAVAQHFIDILFGQQAQMITKDDPVRDRDTKLAALDIMVLGGDGHKPLKLANGQETRKQAVQQAMNYEEQFKAKSAAKQPVAEAIGTEHNKDPIPQPEVKAQLRKGMPHLRDLKTIDFLDLLDELHDGNGAFKLENMPLNVKVDGFGGRFGKDAAGKPFMGTSNTPPRYQAGFVDYHQKKGTTDPEILGRAQLFDDLFTEMMNAVKLVDSKLGPEFLLNKQVTCEVLYLPFATETPEGKLKFVGIHYDKLPSGIQLALVPFRVVEADTGEELPNANEFIKELLSVGKLGSVMFIDNSLTQNEALDVTALVPPIENISQFKAMLADKSPGSLKRKQDVAAALQPVKLALEKAIAEDPNIVGKDILGQDYEGIVLNTRLGPVKVTSTEQRKVIADKLAAKATARTERPRENSSKTAVVAIGSFVGHIGHEQLFDYTINKAKEVGGDPYLFIGNAEGKDDPIPPAVKVQTWHKMYPQYASNISTVQDSGSLIQKIKHELINPLPGKPPRYDNIIIMVGEDRANMNIANALMKAVNKFQGYEHVKVSLEVTPRGTGMSFTKLRNILKDPNATPEQQFQVWSQGFDIKKLGADWIKHLMDLTKKGMGVQDIPQQPAAPAAPAVTPAGSPVAEMRLFNALTMPHLTNFQAIISEDFDNIPLEPIWEEQEEDLRQELLKTPKLFENSADYKNLQNFLKIYSNAPIVGKSYVYTSITSMLPAHLLSVAHFDQPYKLLRYTSGKVIFEINGVKKQFPEGNSVEGDLLKTVLFFPTINDLEKFKTMLGLKFSEWSLKNKIITHTVKEYQDRMAGVGIGNYIVDEGPELKSTLRAISNDIGEPVLQLYATMKQMAKQFYASKGDLKGFQMVAAGAASRWYNNFYFNKLGKELRHLAQQSPRHAAPLNDFLGTLPKNFSALADQLPEILAQMGQKIGDQELARKAQLWIKAKQDFRNYLSELEASGEEDDYDDEPVAKSPKNPAIGQQAGHAEQIVNDVLSKLPSKIAGDIRNAIARAPNKLQALQAELQKRGVKVPMGEGKISELTIDKLLKYKKDLKDSPAPTSLRKGINRVNGKRSAEEKIHAKQVDAALKLKGDPRMAESYTAFYVKELTVDEIVNYVQKSLIPEMRKCGVPIGPHTHFTRLSSAVFEGISKVVDSGKQFLETFKKLDQRKNMQINVGTSVSILNLQLSQDNAELFGFRTPKQITKIYREPTDKKIIQLEFNNDPEDVWPRQPLASYNGNLIMTSAFFPDATSLDKALSMLMLSKPNDITIRKSISENIAESTSAKLRLAKAVQNSQGKTAARQSRSVIPSSIPKKEEPKKTESFPIAAATGVMTRSLPGNTQKNSPHITKSKSTATPAFTAKMQARHDAATGKKSEAMLPKSAFSGSDKNKLGTAGQLRNQKRGAKAGDLVGAESVESKGVKIGEGWETQIASLLEQLKQK
jgi:hypothetical protein